MKTAEQIAREAYGQEPGNGWAVGSNEIVPMIVAAIEADRAQRRADLDVLADAAASWATELVDYVIPAASEAEAAEYEAQCDRITAALGRYLDEAKAEQ